MVEEDLRRRLETLKAERIDFEFQLKVTQSRTEALKAELQDAHVAVVGYQKDCSIQSRCTAELKAKVERLSQGCTDARKNIVAAFGDEVALKERLEQIQMRCVILKEREAELTNTLVTGAVKDQATIRFLRCHLHEAAMKQVSSADRLGALHGQCATLASKSQKLVELLAAQVSSQADVADICKEHIAEPVGSAENSLRASSSLWASTRGIASSSTSNGKPAPHSGRFPVGNSSPSADSTTVSEAPADVPSCSQRSSSGLQRSQLEARRSDLTDNMRQLEELRAGLRDLADTLSAAVDGGVDAGIWRVNTMTLPPDLPERLEASVLPFLHSSETNGAFQVSEPQSSIIPGRLESILSEDSSSYENSPNGALSPQ